MIIKPVLLRAGWFFVLWLSGVLVVGLVGVVIKLFLSP